MSVICISNQKGGAGKTSLTHNLGYVLANKYNKRVLFIDADGQANLTTALGFDPDEQKKTIAELLSSKDSKISQFIISTDHKNIDLIPSSQQTFGAEKKLSDRHGREFVLNDALESVRSKYDFVFIDTPPNLGLITLNALISTNNVIFVYTASEFALDGLSQILGTLDEIRGNRRLNINSPKILGAIHNRFKVATKTVNRKVEEDLKGLEDIEKFFTPISESTEIEKAQFDHQSISVYNPRHKVTKQFETFAKEILKCLA